MMGLIQGGGNVVTFLEDLTERARRGEIEAIACAVVTTNQTFFSTISYHPEAVRPFLSLSGAVATLQHDIQSGALTFE